MTENAHVLNQRNNSLKPTVSTTLVVRVRPAGHQLSSVDGVGVRFRVGGWSGPLMDTRYIRLEDIPLSPEDL